MSVYTENNGLAQFWNREHSRLEYAKWVFHHPEELENLLEILATQQEDTDNLVPMTDEDIDRITGVKIL